MLCSRTEAVGQVAATALTGTASGILMRLNSKWAISLTGRSCRSSLLDADELVHQVQAIELCDRAVETGVGSVHPAFRVVELDGETRLGERECDLPWNAWLSLRSKQHMCLTPLLLPEGKRAEIGSFITRSPSRL